MAGGGTGLYDVRPLDRLLAESGSGLALAGLTTAIWGAIHYPEGPGTPLLWNQGLKTICACVCINIIYIYTHIYIYI